MTEIEIFNKIEALLKGEGIRYEAKHPDADFANSHSFYKKLEIYGRLPERSPEDDWEDDWHTIPMKASISISGGNVGFWEHITGSFKNGRLNGCDRHIISVKDMTEETLEEWTWSLLWVSEVL